jgi:hypothetical protein
VDPAPEDPRRARLAAICLALPEVVREDFDRHSAFLVRGKKFAWFLDDHHGDGLVALCWRALPGQNDALVAADPRRYFRPAYLAARGWAAVRLDLPDTVWADVEDHVHAAYRHTAPRRLVASLPG